MENKKKKRYGIVAALLLLVLAAGVGTYAWLTATQSLDNVFTVGSFGPTDKKPDPTDPEKPGSDENNGAYLFETKWVENSKIVPGATADKNPNVGIKKGSDNAYVFIYVKNAMVKDGTAATDTPYFTLNNNWKPVDGKVSTSADGKYLSGLSCMPRTPRLVPPFWVPRMLPRTSTPASSLARLCSPALWMAPWLPINPR